MLYLCLSGQSTICICCWALALVAAWSSFTTSRDALDKMACSSALVPSLSSNDTDARCALANVKTTLMLGGEEALLQSPLNNWHDLSHARCNGVLPSRSCTAHASGHALASNCTIGKLARVPTATCKGVRLQQSTWCSDSGLSSISFFTMDGGGSNLTHACKLYEERFWEQHDNCDIIKVWWEQIGGEVELTLSFDSVASSLIQLLELLEKIQGCCLSHVQP